MERGVKSIWRVTPSPPPEERERLMREHKAEVRCRLGYQLATLVA